MTTDQKVITKSDAKKKISNLVELDGVLKEAVNKEILTKEQWNAKYGFLKDWKKILYEQAKKLYGLSEEELDAMIHRKRCREKGRSSEPNPDFFKLNPSPPFPETSNAIVGWRSAHPECSLEFFGKLYRSPRFTIHPPDVERDPPEHQTHIMLG